jgi:hypothetical protein
MSTSASDANLLDQTAGVTTALARHTRTLDDRLTLLAMRMTYIALTFFVVCFYFALTYLQIVNEHGLWKPSTLHQPNLALGITEMALVLIGGVVYFAGQWLGLYRRNFSRLQIGLWVAALLGFISIILHVAELHTPGFSLQDGGYASVFVGAEGVYTVLLIVAVLVLVGLANRARLGLFRQSGIAIEAFGEFWGWMAAIALLNFLALYVQPFFPSA